MNTFHVITLFPKIIDTYARTSILKRAQEKNIIQVIPHDLRIYGEGRHKKVDDTPYGGGPGMVMKVEPIYRAVEGIKKNYPSRKKRYGQRVILFSTRGKQFTSKEAKRLSLYDQLIFISGRYEGVDERVASHIADEEISIGSFVLSGGELPSLIALDAIARYIPGVLGKEESLEDIKGSYPVYTRPDEFSPHTASKRKKWSVPSVLLSGDHKKIAEWRRKFDKES